MKRIDRPWLSVTLPILGCFGGGSLYGWSGLMSAVQSAFAAGSAAASMVFSLALVSFMVGVLIRPLLLYHVPQRLHLSVIAFGAAASVDRRLGLLSAASPFEPVALVAGLPAPLGADHRLRFVVISDRYYSFNCCINVHVHVS